MESSLIVEAYAEMFQAYQKIEKYSTLLKQSNVTPELRKIFREQLARATETFQSILDRQVDARLAELMDQARYTLADEIIQREQEHEDQQARVMPQLVAMH